MLVTIILINISIVSQKCFLPYCWCNTFFFAFFFCFLLIYWGDNGWYEHISFRCDNTLFPRIQTICWQSVQQLTLKSFHKTLVFPFCPKCYTSSLSRLVSLGYWQIPLNEHRKYHLASIFAKTNNKKGFFSCYLIVLSISNFSLSFNFALMQPRREDWHTVKEFKG